MQRYEIITNFAHMTEGVKNIECLSLFFTAGVALGTVLVTPSAGLLLPFLALPFFLQKRMIRWPEEVSVGLLLATFLLLGIFSARSAALPVADEETSLEVFCASAAARVRALIDAIPFPSQGTAHLLKALLTGDRSSLSPETVQVFRGSGASHLLALSGLHMGILYLLFDYLTKALGNSPTARRIRFGLILGAAFLPLMGSVGNVWILYLCFAGWGFFRAFFDANIYAALYDVTPEHLHASCSSAMIMTGFAVGATAPYILALIKEATGSLNATLPILGAIWLLCGLACLWVSCKYYNRDHSKITKHE